MTISILTKIKPLKNLLLVALWCYSLSSFALSIEQPPVSPLHIYLDADQTNNAESGKAIALGIRAALYEADNKLGGYPTKLIIKDHHGSAPRSQYHLEQFIEDPKGLLIYGGMHSPPPLSSRDFINENEILTLVPWAAATPITRPTHGENWVFRLSIDDSKAGATIIDNAINTFKSKSPFLLLEDSGWGRANKETMLKALALNEITILGDHSFRWGIGQFRAREILEAAIFKGADSFILVANAPEGLSFVKAMLAMPKDKQRPISSHWGITGGKFSSLLSVQELSQLKLQFVQTDYSPLFDQTHDRAITALQSAASVLEKDSLLATDIAAPAGFVHAYDLTKILIAACNQTTLSGDPAIDRRKIKEQLEQLNISVDGIIKRYQSPFSPYTAGNKDAHEALNAEDLLMAYFLPNGKIKLAPRSMDLRHGGRHEN